MNAFVRRDMLYMFIIFSLSLGNRFGNDGVIIIVIISLLHNVKPRYKL